MMSDFTYIVWEQMITLSKLKNLQGATTGSFTLNTKWWILSTLFSAAWRTRSWRSCPSRSRLVPVNERGSRLLSPLEITTATLVSASNALKRWVVQILVHCLIQPARSLFVWWQFLTYAQGWHLGFNHEDPSICLILPWFELRHPNWVKILMLSFSFRWPLPSEAILAKLLIFPVRRGHWGNWLGKPQISPR